MQMNPSKTMDDEVGTRGLSPFLGRLPANVAYATRCGRMLYGKSDEILVDGSLSRFEGKVNLSAHSVYSTNGRIF